MEMELTKLLQQQSQEIADAGHAGWGNTMADAARAIEAIRADKMAMFEDAKRWAEEAGRLAAELSDARLEIAGLRRDAERLDFLEAFVRKAYIYGASFDFAKSAEGERGGYRFMSRARLGQRHSTIRQAIDAAMPEKQEGQ